MSKSGSIPLPAAHALRKLGRDLALARRKRGISTSDMATRLFVSRDTLWRMERGDPTVALGTLRRRLSFSVYMTAWRISPHLPVMNSLSVLMNAVCRNASAVRAYESRSLH